MQISAANLLLAAQQPAKAGASAPARQTPFASAMADAKAPAKRLDLPSFDDAGEPVAEKAAAPAVMPSAAPYGAASAPGTKLDIRV